MKFAAVVALALAVVLAGCRDAPETEAAQRAVEKQAIDARAVDCTTRSVRWFREGPPAKRFLCVARREHGHCDRYLVERAGNRFDARRLARDTVDCALPVG